MSRSLLLFNSRETNSTNDLYGKRVKLSDHNLNSKNFLVTPERLPMQSRENVERHNITIDSDYDNDDDEGCCVIAEIPRKKNSQSTFSFLSRSDQNENSKWKENNIKTLSSINNCNKSKELNLKNNTTDKNQFSCLKIQKKQFFSSPRCCLNQNKIMKSRLAYKNNIKKKINFLQECYRLTEKLQYIKLLQSQTSCFTPKKESSFKNLSASRSIPVIDLTDECNSPKAKNSSIELSTRELLSNISRPHTDEDVQIIKEVQGPRCYNKFSVIKSFKDEKTEPKNEGSSSQTKLNNELISLNRLNDEEGIHIIEKNYEKPDLELLEVKLHNLMHLDDKIIEIEKEDNKYEKYSLPQLTFEQKKLVEAALVAEPKEEVLVKGFGLCITRRGMQTLKGSNWLNDEVINFYLSLIMERSSKNIALPKVYAFNTFFYPKLVASGYSSLKRWTKQVDIFSYDIILVPVHLGMHWCLSVIDLRSKFIKYFDSVGSPNDTCLQHLLNYLKCESIDKKNKVLNEEEWILVCVEDIPQQMNGSDCGVFSCMFAEYQARDAEISFTQDDMPYFRKKIVFEILSKKLLT